MSSFNKNSIPGFTVAFIVTVLLFLSSSCSNKNDDFLPTFKDRGSVPGMYTDSVTTLISDSGRIRYRIYCKQWKIFDKSFEPYWFFPNKLHFERFNDQMVVESVLDCDTARYFTGRKVWELKNNVRIVNMQGELFESQLLYWDERSQRVYTDSFIRIEEKNAIISAGKGFESNQTFTKYRILKPSGPIDMESDQPDSLQMDPTSRANTVNQTNSNVVSVAQP